MTAKRLPRFYQAVWFLMKLGKPPAPDEAMTNVKVIPFRLPWRTVQCQPISQAYVGELDVGNYALSPFAATSQAFNPMNFDIRVVGPEVDYSEAEARSKKTFEQSPIIA